MLDHVQMPSNINRPVSITFTTTCQEKKKWQDIADEKSVSLSTLLFYVTKEIGNGKE